MMTAAGEPMHSVRGLRDAIRRAKVNVNTMIRAIRREKATITDYKDMLETGRGGFPEAGLRNGINGSRRNIRVLRKAIADEREGIGRYREMVDAQKLAKKLSSPILVPIERDDNGG